MLRKNNLELKWVSNIILFLSFFFLFFSNKNLIHLNIPLNICLNITTTTITTTRLRKCGKNIFNENKKINKLLFYIDFWSINVFKLLMY